MASGEAEDLLIDETNVRHDGTRSAARSAVSIQVQIHAQGAAPATFITDDLSPTGMFVCTARPHPPGTRLRLTFALPRGALLQVDAEVAWNTQQAGRPTASGRHGMGLRFVRMPPAASDAMARYFKAQTATAFGTR